jgi:hypothetical protein
MFLQGHCYSFFLNNTLPLNKAINKIISFSFILQKFDVNALIVIVVILVL